MDYKITRVTEEPLFLDGRPDSEMRVEFTVGLDGPFYERFRKADFTPFAVQERLEKFTRDVKQMRG